MAKKKPTSKSGSTKFSREGKALFDRLSAQDLSVEARSFLESIKCPQRTPKASALIEALAGLNLSGESRAMPRAFFEAVANPKNETKAYLFVSALLDVIPDSGLPPKDRDAFETFLQALASVSYWEDGPGLLELFQTHIDSHYQWRIGPRSLNPMLGVLDALFLNWGTLKRPQELVNFFERIQMALESRDADFFQSIADALRLGASRDDGSIPSGAVKVPSIRSVPKKGPPVRTRSVPKIKDIPADRNAVFFVRRWWLEFVIQSELLGKRDVPTKAKIREDIDSHLGKSKDSINWSRVWKAAGLQRLPSGKLPWGGKPGPSPKKR